MKPQFKILSGLTKGSTSVFSKSEILLGRHQGSDLRFDLDLDTWSSKGSERITLRSRFRIRAGESPSAVLARCIVRVSTRTLSCSNVLSVG